MKTYCDQFSSILTTIKNVDLSVIFDEDVSTPEFLILSLINHVSETKKSDSVWVSEIVERVTVTAQAVSKLLRSMESKGYIHRLTDAADRRRTRVVMTKAGTTLYGKLNARFEELMQIIDSGFEEGEFAELLRLIKKFGSLCAAGVCSLAVGDSN